MFGLNKKESENITWSVEAEKALEQALDQFPGPKLMVLPIKGKLISAAETAAKEAGHEQVKPEDLMKGLMSMIPADMQAKIEERMKEGPEGLKKLEEDLKNYKR